MTDRLLALAVTPLWLASVGGWAVLVALQQPRMLLDRMAALLGEKTASGG